jgi:hypothetical protein
MNRLAGLAGVAQTATNNTQAAGTNYANNISANQISSGQIRAGGIYGSANAWSNFGQKAAQGLGYGLSAYQQNYIPDVSPSYNPVPQITF